MAILMSDSIPTGQFSVDSAAHGAGVSDCGCESSAGKAADGEACRYGGADAAADRGRVRLSRQKLDPEMLAMQNIRPGNVTEFSSVEAIKQCVIAGMGLGLLPA